jgi:hypothetical protein
MGITEQEQAELVKRIQEFRASGLDEKSEEFKILLSDYVSMMKSNPPSKVVEIRGQIDAGGEREPNL